MFVYEQAGGGAGGGVGGGRGGGGGVASTPQKNTANGKSKRFQLPCDT